MFIDFLIKKDILRLIPVEQTFFITVDFTSDKKLSYESVLFNYQNLSPYKNSAVSYINKDGKLLLWFYEQSYRHVFSVPEGFLYYHYFSNQDNNILVNIENKITFVIQNGLLAYQSFCRKTFIEEKELLRKKYNIQNTIDKSAQWDKEHHKKILNRPIYILVDHFLDKKLFMHMLKEKSIQMLIPTMIFLLFLTGIHFGLNQYLQKELDHFIQEKEKTRKKIRGIFEAIKINNNNIAFLQEFLNNYNGLDMDIAVHLANIIDKTDGKLYQYIHNKRFITLRMECKDIESFLEDLSKIEQVKAYKLTRQRKLKSGTNDIAIEITLKTKKDNSNEQ